MSCSTSVTLVPCSVVMLSRKLYLSKNKSKVLWAYFEVFILFFSMSNSSIWKTFVLNSDHWVVSVSPQVLTQTQRVDVKTCSVASERAAVQESNHALSLVDIITDVCVFLHFNGGKSRQLFFCVTCFQMKLLTLLLSFHNNFPLSCRKGIRASCNQ